MQNGKKLTVLSGEELLSIDERPPVLYLRSFWNDDDMATVPLGNVEEKKSFWGTVIIRVLPSIKNEEELLAKQLKRIGPPIAVGSPNEEFTRLGMARMHFNDDEWQEKVTELINRSALVIMLAGFTSNFWWELETVVRNLDPKKLIVLLPFETRSESTLGISVDVNAYKAFKEKADIILPKNLPQFSGTIIRGSTLSGLMYFSSDWNPKIYQFDKTDKSLKKNLIHFLSYY